jgi:hypothetical protein
VGGHWPDLFRRVLGYALSKALPPLGLEGKKYKARVDAGGFEVIGEQSTWRMRWTDIARKGEDNRVFMFCYSGGVLFIFGKRYIDEKQQESLRSLAGLSPCTASPD